jgi:hypothetical protein
MSVSDVRWTPAGGGPGRFVPACSACAHKVEHGLEPDMRKVETHGALSSYVDAGFARHTGAVTASPPEYSIGFLLGQALAPNLPFPTNFPSAAAVTSAVAGAASPS